ncbi:MAG: hypothetical protein P1P81_08060, partial [Desulfobulbales bacterium]|nr:hypothetical protein [Desulfobulbales bacterium]
KQDESGRRKSKKDGTDNLPTRTAARQKVRGWLSKNRQIEGAHISRNEASSHTLQRRDNLPQRGNRRFMPLVVLSAPPSILNHIAAMTVKQIIRKPLGPLRARPPFPAAFTPFA